MEPKMQSLDLFQSTVEELLRNHLSLAARMTMGLISDKVRLPHERLRVIRSLWQTIGVDLDKLEDTAAT